MDKTAVVGAPKGKTPVPGSVIDKCVHCGEELWLSPNSQRLRDAGAEVVCLLHALLNSTPGETEVFSSADFKGME